MRRSCLPIHGCLRRVQSTAFSRPPPSTFQYRLEVPGSGGKRTFRSGQFVWFPLFLKFNERQDSSSLLITQVLVTPLGECNHAPPLVCSGGRRHLFPSKQGGLQDEKRSSTHWLPFRFLPKSSFAWSFPTPLLFSIYDLRPRTTFDGAEFDSKKSRFLSDFGLGIVAIGFVFGGLRVACYSISTARLTLGAVISIIVEDPSSSSVLFPPFFLSYTAS